MNKLKKNIAISESGFLFNPTSGDSFTVNPIGLDILKMMREGKEYDAIMEMIILQYDVTADMFEKYYLDFMGALKSEGFIEN